jgi:hypothetical protein
MAVFVRLFLFLLLLLLVFLFLWAWIGKYHELCPNPGEKVIDSDGHQVGSLNNILPIGGGGSIAKQPQEWREKWCC